LTDLGTCDSSRFLARKWLQLAADALVET
jgi:hypothetical protein